MATFDQGALEALYRAVERPLYNVVYRWLWNEADAMEVVQEAFLRLWRMRARVDPATARPLVYRIALNQASNRRRRRKVAEALRLSAPLPAPDAESRTATEQTRLAVREAVERLPEKQRRVVVLTELSGLGYQQVAAILNIPVGTVASRRSSAMKTLKGRLRGLRDE